MKYAMSAILCGIVCTAAVVRAGGGGENMLLVVNPNEENSLRIAQAYQQIRGIPDRNIVFVTPPTLTTGYLNPNVQLSTTSDVLMNTYVNPLAAAIASRGLTNQIDYIGVLGQSMRYTYSGSYANSVTYALSLLTPLSAGAMTPADTAWATSNLYATPSLTPGGNTVIHHADTYTAYLGGKNVSAQYYQTGFVGFTGREGNTADQVIANLQRTANGDGTKPVGTVYFEDNNDIRTSIRTSEWPATQAQLTARRIPWVQEPGRDTSPQKNLLTPPTNSPKDKPDVRGAVVGTGIDNFPMPNGSTYLPGSWADNMTSSGAVFDQRGQTKATVFLAAGAGATCGAVWEPYAIASRCPNTSVHTFIADGNTLGEAFNKSVQTPDMEMFIGDMLAQPYADVPRLTLNSAPANGSTVSGNISLDTAATLNNPTLATGIKQLKLLVDGVPVGATINAATGVFNLDTTSLSDGRHELRVVAINNAAAESENAVRVIVNVNNHGQAVLANNGGNILVGAKQVVPLGINAVANGATLSRVELRNLGRSLGSTTSATGAINLDASKLAYGENTVTPVAILSDGSEVAGSPITVTRDRQWMPGKPVTPVANRVPGIRAEYFIGKGANTIVGSNFSGTPDIDTTTSRIWLCSGLKESNGMLSTVLYPTPDYMATTAVSRLALRLSGKFKVDTAGEFQFFYRGGATEGLQLSIDGQVVDGFDNQSGGFSVYAPSLFLGAGEHDLAFLATRNNSSITYDLALEYRDPDGITNIVDGNLLYQSVPEPGSGVLTMMILGGTLLKRRCWVR